MADERASIFDDDTLDVSGFAPKPADAAPAINREALRATAESRGFSSREPTREIPAAPPAPPAPVAAVPSRAQRRHRTGRNRQLNLKLTDDAVERFYDMAEREGVVLGQALERLLDSWDRAHGVQQ
jgi:hypothetical protein